MERTIVEGVDLEATGALVVRVRPKRSERSGTGWLAAGVRSRHAVARVRLRHAAAASSHRF